MALFFKCRVIMPLSNTLKQIEELYAKANEETEGFKWIHGMNPALREFDRMLENMPQEAWIQ